MDQFLHVYDKDDDLSYGVYKILLESVADALGCVTGFDCNMKAYHRTIHEPTNEYLVENREFITIKVVDDKILLNTRFHNTHALKQQLAR